MNTSSINVSFPVHYFEPHLKLSSHPNLRHCMREFWKCNISALFSAFEWKNVKSILFDVEALVASELRKCQQDLENHSELQKLDKLATGKDSELLKDGSSSCVASMRAELSKTFAKVLLLANEFSVCSKKNEEM